MNFLQCLIDKQPGVKQKALLRLESVAGILEISDTTCELIIERRDGTVEKYLIEGSFDQISSQILKKKK
jgi:hypothetical protein